MQLHGCKASISLSVFKCTAVLLWFAYSSVDFVGQTFFQDTKNCAPQYLLRSLETVFDFFPVSSAATMIWIVSMADVDPQPKNSPATEEGSSQEPLQDTNQTGKNYFSIFKKICIKVWEPYRRTC